ncbi:hypothetical protein [Tessaracoccus coleopterorum]|uniref:hypothetical protein n=1 Tax=Tessaracoccus coleopterorum TaxID=2714950 RepID=UPI0018D3A048|nr:hypothetical protein [Tessaracoccus coleopterorum]
MLVGWSLAGVVGPLVASALVGPGGNYRLAFSVMGALAVAGVALPLVTRPPRRAGDADTLEEELASA